MVRLTDGRVIDISIHPPPAGWDSKNGQRIMAFFVIFAKKRMFDDRMHIDTIDSQILFSAGYA